MRVDRSLQNQFTFGYEYGAKPVKKTPRYNALSALKWAVALLLVVGAGSELYRSQKSCEAAHGASSILCVD